MPERMVFILGAGFTRAFMPKAPLLVDDYDIPNLRKQFASFPHALAILDYALSQGRDGCVDLEQLLTRLSGMPYDSVDARLELSLLESSVRKALVRRLKDAKAAGFDSNALGAFANFVLTNEANIVTFNYDDLLDQALWEVRKLLTLYPSYTQSSYWHPDGGYGFFCRPSSVCIADTQVLMDRPRTLMLKLHGTINWRWRLGEELPHGPAAILHHEPWLPVNSEIPYAMDRIESHLGPEPFIVPPVLIKSELTLHPVLRVVWENAYQILKDATTIVFIGYSLPDTDLASRILFRETLSNTQSREIQIVNIAIDGNEKERIKNAYRSLFPDLPDANFDFSGAANWVEHQIEQIVVSTNTG